MNARTRLAIAIGALLAIAAPAAAQSLSANSASYNAGYGRTSGEENRPIALASARDANGNRTIIDGIIQTGAATVSSKFASIESSMGLSGGVGGGGGLGGGSSTAVGNSLTVVTQGNNNTVIVNATQTNTGNISSTVGGVGQ